MAPTSPAASTPTQVIAGNDWDALLTFPIIGPVQLELLLTVKAIAPSHSSLVSGVGVVTQIVKVPAVFSKLYTRT